jgi:hypothetical protein
MVLVMVNVGFGLARVEVGWGFAGVDGAGGDGAWDLACLSFGVLCEECLRGISYLF